MAIQFVNTTSNTTASAPNLDIAYAPTSGNFVAVWLVYLNSSNGFTSVTDNAGSVYQVAFQDTGVAGNWCTALYYTLNAKIGVTTITAAVPVNGIIAGIVAEFSGLSALDAVSSIKVQNTTTHTTNAITPIPMVSELLLGWFFNSSNSNDFSAGGTSTFLLNQDAVGAGADLAAVYEIISSTSGTYTANATTSVAEDSWGYVTSFMAASTTITGLGRKHQGFSYTYGG